MLTRTPPPQYIVLLSICMVTVHWDHRVNHNTKCVMLIRMATIHCGQQDNYITVTLHYDDADDQWFNCHVDIHQNVIKWKHLHVTVPLWGESTGHCWIPLTKASDAELWRFPWYAHVQAVKQVIETPLIWDDTAFIMTSPSWHGYLPMRSSKQYLHRWQCCPANVRGCLPFCELRDNNSNGITVRLIYMITPIVSTRHS